MVPQPVTTPSPGNAVLFGAEIGAAVFDEHVELLEAAGIEQKFDAFARGQLAAGMLGRDARLAAAGLCQRPARFQFGNNIFHGTRDCGAAEQSVKPATGAPAAAAMVHFRGQAPGPLLGLASAPHFSA